MTDCGTTDRCAVVCARCPTTDCERVRIKEDNEKRIRKEVQKSASEATIARRRGIVSKMVGESACPDNLSQAGGPGDLARSTQASCRGLDGEPIDCATVSYNLGRIKTRTRYKNHEGVDKKHNSYERYTSRLAGAVLMKEQTPLVKARRANVGQPRNRTGTSACTNPCGGILTSSTQCLSGCFYAMRLLSDTPLLDRIVIGTTRVTLLSLSGPTGVILGVSGSTTDLSIVVYISCADGLMVDVALQSFGSAIDFAFDASTDPDGEARRDQGFITLNPACCRQRIPSCAASTFYLSIEVVGAIGGYSREPYRSAEGTIVSSSPELLSSGPIIGLGWFDGAFDLAVKGKQSCLNVASVTVVFPLSEVTFTSRTVLTTTYNKAGNFTVWTWTSTLPSQQSNIFSARVLFSGTFNVKGCRGNNTQCVGGRCPCGKYNCPIHISRDVFAPGPNANPTNS